MNKRSCSFSNEFDVVPAESTLVLAFILFYQNRFDCDFFKGHDLKE
jgi:hypothetical protein